MMKDLDENVMTDQESVLRIWKEYYKGLMNDENEGEREREREWRMTGRECTCKWRG